tara:strand:- start:373 stop:1239 length:867 start_codon:yes stop_codon:yes gene_type:complete
MNQLNLFFELTRLKRPIGYMLLFWPCAWGLTIAYDFSLSLKIYFFYLLMFFLGSILMRSAGCIVNDVLDRKFDEKVFRTKNRPIASGKISVKLGLFYASLLCLLAFFILISFNLFTIIIALASMPLAFTYPLMKRFTYWPQLFLGITFNYGLILGWTSINAEINLIPLIFYFGAIFWTLAYDTIYGFQDIKDDEIIGLKSTSIKFKSNPIILLYLCYIIFLSSLILIGLLNEFSKLYFLSLIIIVYHMYFIQLNKFKSNEPEICLKIFQSNNLLGGIILISLLVGKLN